MNGPAQFASTNETPGVKRDLTGAPWRVRVQAVPPIVAGDDRCEGREVRDAPTVQSHGWWHGVPAIVANRWFPATVPGCIHTDLLDAVEGGVIPDPAIADHEHRVQWVSHADWRYECEFALDASEADAANRDGLEVCFECLDTIARIELNGTHLGDAASEFLPWSFPTRGTLRPGTNTLAVTFSSPLSHIHAEAKRLGPRPVNGDWDPYIFIRKCASNFQWDWGPRVATVGITGRVWLGRAAPLPIARVAPALHAIVDCKNLDASPASNLTPLAFADNPPSSLGPRFMRGINWIPDGLWPRDRSPARVRQRLQALRDAGINMIRVWGGGRYEPDWFYELCDELGLFVWQDFMFSCAMYPEDEPLRTLIEREARHHVARLARFKNVVLWCGGNECTWAHDNWGFKDKLAPGQTWGRGYFTDVLPRAVREIDPSRAYWPNSPWSRGSDSPPSPAPSGGGGRVREAGGGSRGASSAETSPQAWPPCNDPDPGDRHTWDIWGDGYRDPAAIPRFCSEFGQQSPSCWSTLREAGLLPDAQAAPRDWPEAVMCVPLGTPPPHHQPFDSAHLPPLLLARQRGPGDPLASPPVSPMQRWYDRPMAAWFHPARDLFEWHYLAQLLQARSMQIGIEWFRAHMHRCHGALIWQANDAWPGFSWSIIDSAGRNKLAWHAVKRAFAAQRLTIQPLEGAGGALTLIAINDADEPWQDEAEARRVGLDGTVHQHATIPFTAPPRTATRIANLTALLGTPANPHAEVLVAIEIDPSSPCHRGRPGDLGAPDPLNTTQQATHPNLADRAWWFFVPDRDLRPPTPTPPHTPPFQARTNHHGSTRRLHVHAHTFCRDVCVIADATDPILAATTQLVTLLPGEAQTFRLDPA